MVEETVKESRVEKFDVPFALMQKDIENIKEFIKEIRSDLKSMMGIFVTNKQYTEDKVELKEALTKKVDTNDFEPIKRLVYGLVGAVLLTVLAAGLSYFIINR